MDAHKIITLLWFLISILYAIFGIDYPSKEGVDLDEIIELLEEYEQKQAKIKHEEENAKQKRTIVNDFIKRHYKGDINI